MRLSEVRPDHRDVAPLIEAHLSHSAAHSPETSRHTLTADDLDKHGIRMFALSEGGNGGVVACGALKSLPDGSVEVKSVHVVEHARGRGLGRAMLRALEAEARGMCATAMVLETGSDRLDGYAAARALYEAEGFETCGPVPGYAPDPNSAFYRKSL